MSWIKSVWSAMYWLGMSGGASNAVVLQRSDLKKHILHFHDNSSFNKAPCDKHAFCLLDALVDLSQQYNKTDRNSDQRPLLKLASEEKRKNLMDFCANDESACSAIGFSKSDRNIELKVDVVDGSSTTSFSFEQIR